MMTKKSCFLKQSVESQLTFQRNTSHPSSQSKNNPYSAYYLLHDSWLFGLFFDPEDRDYVFSETLAEFHLTIRGYAIAYRNASFSFRFVYWFLFVFPCCYPVIFSMYLKSDGIILTSEGGRESKLISRLYYDVVCVAENSISFGRLVPSLSLGLVHGLRNQRLCWEQQIMQRYREKCLYCLLNYIFHNLCWVAFTRTTNLKFAWIRAMFGGHPVA
jgi:hypothetical protein